METLSASAKEEDAQHYLCLHVPEGELRISLTGDNPNDVKSVFNSLVKRLKNGKFKFEMSEVGADLFSQVASEYIKQLNRDLSAVYKELDHHQLILDDGD